MTTLLFAFLVHAATDKPVSLFDGRSLAGWEGDPKVWSVRDGAIVGEPPVDPAHPRASLVREHTYLVYQGEMPPSFELKVSYRILKGNSGVQYRSLFGEAGRIVRGYQADLDAGTAYTGSLHDENGRGALAKRGERSVVRTKGDTFEIVPGKPLGTMEGLQKAVRDRDWNEYRVEARGNRLRHWINGRETADVRDEDAPRAAASGALALQVHGNVATRVEFRSIAMRDLHVRASDAVH